MDMVIVEFAVGAALAEECIEALTGLMTSVVAKQRKFHGATIHVEETTGTVINLMKWDRAEDFVEFRDSNQAVIGPILGKYEPKGRMLKIVAQIESNH